MKNAPLVLLAGIAALFASARAARLPDYTNPTPGPELQRMLDAKTDLWGEAAMRREGGPTYEFFRDLLPPLRYCDPDFRHYPILLSAPGSLVKARLISNGSAVNAHPTGGIQWRLWKDYPVSASFRLGEEAFGEELERLDGPRYYRGYLPIVRVSYRQGGATCEQESFVAVTPPFSDHGGILVRFALSGGQPLDITVALDSPLKLSMENGVVRDEQGLVHVVADAEWTWDGGSRSLTVRLDGKRSACLAVFSEPLTSTPPEIGQSAYEKHLTECADEWEKLLSGAMRVEVPEKVVNDAWKSLIIGSLMMKKGDAMCYGGGNGYERLFLAECGDSVRALMVWGFTDEAKAMTVPLLDYVQPGLKYHEAGHKLQIVSHVYWMTRDAGFVQANRTRWGKELLFITDDREADTGLLPKDDYAGDIARPVYSLNSNANSWRGLRDMGAVLDDIGEREEARKLLSTAYRFRKSIIAAVERSEDRTTSPPFIPNALFGEEKAYDVLTASRMGSYWNLLIPYVVGSGVFGVGDERERWIMDYLQQHGGIAMGMIRFHQESNVPDYDRALDDLYGLRYAQALLRRDDVERALVSFYGKLAQGMTRDTFICAEGTGLVPLDEHGRALSMPPNSSANALFLTTLREMLVQDYDLDDDGRPDTLRLLFATPERWLRDGSVIRVERAPTQFGEVSVTARSELRKGRVTLDVRAPEHAPDKLLARARLPRGWQVVRATVGGHELRLAGTNTVDLSGRTGSFTAVLEVGRART